MKLWARGIAPPPAATSWPSLSSQALIPLLWGCPEQTVGRKQVRILSGGSAPCCPEALDTPSPSSLGFECLDQGRADLACFPSLEPAAGCSVK